MEADLDLDELRELELERDPLLLELEERERDLDFEGDLDLDLLFAGDLDLLFFTGDLELELDLLCCVRMMKDEDVDGDTYTMSAGQGCQQSTFSLIANRRRAKLARENFQIFQLFGLNSRVPT